MTVTLACILIWAQTYKKKSETKSDKTRREASRHNKITPIRANKQEDRDDEKKIRMSSEEAEINEKLMK